MKQLSKTVVVAMLCALAALRLPAQQSQNQSQQAQGQNQQGQTVPPPCVAPKKLSLAEKLKRKAEAKAEQIAAREENQAGQKASHATDGAVDGTLLPSAQDVVSSTPKPAPPCVPPASKQTVKQ